MAVNVRGRSIALAVDSVVGVRSAILLPYQNLQLIVVDAIGEVLLSYPATRPGGVGTTAHSLAYVIYTSGSTGRPKGAMNEQGGIVNRLQWMQEYFQLDSSDAVLQKTSFSFDVSVWELLWPLLSGARLVRGMRR